MIEREELAAWLRLVETPGLGPVALRRLLAEFGDPGRLVAASEQAHTPASLSAKAAQALRTPSESWADRVDSDWAWLQESPGRHIVTLADPSYPRALLETPDPPFLIYAIGDLALFNRPSLGIVGSRNPTPQGRDNSRAFGEALSQAGLTIVSGLALGIDGAAHEGALGGRGKTLAVIGTGLDRVYPRQHLALARRIADEGLLISECPLGTPPLRANFPRRNRLIAGLSLGTLVVEAALQSGSLITARLAAELGREVLAIPGSIHSPQARGCHALIKQGAKLVESAADVLEELRWDDVPAPAPKDDAPIDVGARSVAGLLDIMGYDPVSLDALCERTGLDPSRLNVQLLELELAGRVARLPGQQFQRVAMA